MQKTLKMFRKGIHYKEFTPHSRKEIMQLITREIDMIPVHKRNQIYFEVMSICNPRAKQTV